VIGPVPVEAVAAEADAHLVGLGTVVRLAAPDAEEAQQQALVGHAVEVVELRLHLEVVTPRIRLILGSGRPLTRPTAQTGARFGRHSGDSAPPGDQAGTETIRGEPG
jgi:hypothetical protein